MTNEQYPRTIQDLGTLTPAEKTVLDSCGNGDTAQISDTRPTQMTAQNRVRAGLIRYMMLGGCDTHPSHERGVRIEGAWIDGEINLDFCDVGGGLLLHKCRLSNTLRISNATMAMLDLSGSLTTSIIAISTTFRGSVYFARNFESNGELVLAASHIGGQFSLDGGKLHSSRSYALNAESLEVSAHINMRLGFSAFGEVCFSLAKIGGTIECDGARFDSGKRKYALNLQAIHVRDSVFIRDGFKSNGEISLSGANIDGHLLFSDAVLNANTSDAYALNARTINVGRDIVFSDGFNSVGTVDFGGATCGRLHILDASFACDHDNALSLRDISVRSAFKWWKVEVAVGALDLRGANTDILEDQLESWPDDLRLDGFTYNRIMQNTDVDARLAWLAKNKSTDFKPQPYQQLAKVFGDIGHRIDRARVLRRMENGIRAQQRKTMPPGRRAIKRMGDEIMRIVVGYGYFPERALIVGLVLIATTWAGISYVACTGAMTPTAAPVLMSSDWQTKYAPMKKAGKKWSKDNAPGKDYETLRPLLYAFDVVVPLINIGQETTWGPSTSRGIAGTIAHWALPIVKTLGWIITALGAAAVTGTIRRD